MISKKYKVDYCQAVNSADKGWLAYILWHVIAPGWTAFFLILTSLWYYRKASLSENEAEKNAYNDAASALLLWGLLNAVAYYLIVTKQWYFTT